MNFPLPKNILWKSSLFLLKSTKIKFAAKWAFACFIHCSWAHNCSYSLKISCNQLYNSAKYDVLQPFSFEIENYSSKVGQIVLYGALTIKLLIKIEMWGCLILQRNEEILRFIIIEQLSLTRVDRFRTSSNFKLTFRKVKNILSEKQKNKFLCEHLNEENRL